MRFAEIVDGLVDGKAYRRPVDRRGGKRGWRVIEMQGLPEPMLLIRVTGGGHVGNMRILRSDLAADDWEECPRRLPRLSGRTTHAIGPSVLQPSIPIYTDNS